MSDRLLDGPIEIRGLELAPPLWRRLLSGCHPLLEVTRILGRELRTALGRVLGLGRGRRLHEVRLDRTGGLQSATRERRISIKMRPGCKKGSQPESALVQSDPAVNNWGDLVTRASDGSNL